MSKEVRLTGSPDNLLEIIFGILRGLSPFIPISDLVQNGIDAGASNISIRLTRDKNKRSQAISKLVITDDGYGFLESFERYSQNIANSIKKNYSNYLKKKDEGLVRGEFGIGMQGFRAIADEMDVYNITKNDENLLGSPGDVDLRKMIELRRMRLYNGKVEVRLDEKDDFGSNEMELCRGMTNGVIYVLKGIRENASKQLTLGSLKKFLSEQKREDLIRNKRLRISIIEGEKTEIVTPVQYIGEKKEFNVKLSNMDNDVNRKGLGEIKCELYFHKPKAGSKLVVTVKGEPVYMDLCRSLEQFDHEPWNSGMVEGTIEYDRLSKLPNRIDVEKNVFFSAFLEMLENLENSIKTEVLSIEHDSRDLKNKKLMDKLKDVFDNIRREVNLSVLGSSDLITKGPLHHLQTFPERLNVPVFKGKVVYVYAYDYEGHLLTGKDGLEYSWNVPGKLGERVTAKGSEAIFSAGSIRGDTQILVEVNDTRTGMELDSKVEVMVVFPVQVGSFYRARIDPPMAKIKTNSQKEFVAVAEDIDGNAITDNLKTSWEIIEDSTGKATINKNYGERIVLSSGDGIGTVKLGLRITQGRIFKEDFAIIEVQEGGKRKKNKRGFDLPRLDYTNNITDKDWHSKLDTLDKGEIQTLWINEANEDYKRIAKDEKRRQKYIAWLYMKELILVDSGKKAFSPGVNWLNDFGEKFIAVLSSFERNWKP